MPPGSRAFSKWLDLAPVGSGRIHRVERREVGGQQSIGVVIVRKTDGRRVVRRRVQHVQGLRCNAMDGDGAYPFLDERLLIRSTNSVDVHSRDGQFYRPGYRDQSIYQHRVRLADPHFRRTETKRVEIDHGFYACELILGKLLDIEGRPGQPLFFAGKPNENEV